MTDYRTEESIGALAVRLSEDAKAYFRAELNYWKTLASDRGGDVAAMAVFGAAAAAIAFAVLILLLVGFMLALALYLGFFWATIVVAAVALLAAWLCATMAYLRFRRLTRPPGEIAREIERGRR